MTRSYLVSAMALPLGIAATAVALALPRGGEAAEPAHIHQHQPAADTRSVTA